MGVPVYMPKKQESNAMGRLLQVGGLALGAYNPALFGAGTTMLGGAAAGGGIGGMAAGLVSNNQPQGPAPVSAPESSMQRRMQAKSSDPLETLRQGALAVSDPNVNPDARAEYAKPVLTAYMAEAKKRGLQDPFKGFPEVG